ADIYALGPNSLTMNDGARTLRYYLQTLSGVTSLMVDDGSTTSVVIGNLVNDPTTQPLFTLIALPGYQPATPGTVDTSSCVIYGQTPTAYEPRCVGILTVNLRVMPTDAAGHALCVATGGCVINVNDDADI